MGGIGKSRLAWEYCRAFRESYPAGVWWVSVVNPSELLQELLAFGGRMGFPELPDTLNTPEQQVQWCYQQWLTQYPEGDRLLVMDDVQGQDGLRQLKPFRPRDSRFRVLMTSRSQFGPPIKSLPLQVLSPLAAVIGSVALGSHSI